MKAMIGFFRAMLSMPWPWVAWVMLLMTFNMVIPLFFLGAIEATVVLAAIIFGAFVQTAIFSAKGFVRLLGVGHIAWIPMAAWLSTRVGLAPAGSPFRYWILGVITVVSLSLVIDVADVIRYLRGEREPTV